MPDDLVKRLWESDAASALTNEAARRIEQLQTTPNYDLSAAPENIDLLLWGSWQDWGAGETHRNRWAIGQKWGQGAGWHVIGNTMSLRFRPICWMSTPPDPEVP